MKKYNFYNTFTEKMMQSCMAFVMPTEISFELA